MMDFSDLRKLRVVIADDEPDTVRTLSQILADEGHDVVGVGTAAAAIREIQNQVPDAVLVDISMPGASGYDVAREARRIYGNLAPMMVAISGKWKGQTDRMLVRLAGFNHFLEKPCDPKAIVDLLKDLRQRPPNPPVNLADDTLTPPEHS